MSASRLQLKVYGSYIGQASSAAPIGLDVTREPARSSLKYEGEKAVSKPYAKHR